MAHLVVLLAGEPIGVLEQHQGGVVSFVYDRGWRDRADSYPLSLSMPLTQVEHEDAAVRPFLEGLLPDNKRVLERWGRQFHVSPKNPYAMLANIGEDCAGAVQFVDPRRADELLSQTGEVQWLTDVELSELLIDLVERHGTGRFVADHGQFSLAGAQPKTALYFEEGRWGIPSGSVPTTHILKPPAQKELDGFEINELFCLRLAAALGQPAARATVEDFAGQKAIVVERYDRRAEGAGRVSRVHQEDTCQALAVPPWTKYENEGGPGAPDLIHLLRRESTDPQDDVAALIDALALNWAIAGTDGHAKNYSMMLGPGEVRLAPLYDLLSTLPYRSWVPYRRAKLAMRIGREYAVWKIRARHWKWLADRADLDAGPVLQRVGELVASIPAAAVEVAEAIVDDGLDQDFVATLRDEVVAHSQKCLDALS